MGSCNRGYGAGIAGSRGGANTLQFKAVYGVGMRFKRRFFFCAIGLLLLLSACSQTFDWHQRIRIVVMTPKGEVAAETVQAIEAVYFPKWQQIGGYERNYSMRGEAVAADLGDGQYLFVLLADEMLAERVLPVDRSHANKPGYLRDIENLEGAGPVEIQPERRPRLVSFDDISDPKSLRLVDPNNLAAAFGPGFALQSMTLEITADPITFGQIEAVLGGNFFRRWAADHQAALKRGISDPYFETSSSKMSRGNFIRGDL